MSGGGGGIKRVKLDPKSFIFLSCVESAERRMHVDF